MITNISPTPNQKPNQTKPNQTSIMDRRHHHPGGGHHHHHPPPPPVHHHHPPPPPPVVHHHPPHHHHPTPVVVVPTPAPPPRVVVVDHHHSSSPPPVHHSGDIFSRPSVKMYCKADSTYSLSISHGKVILVRSNPSDPLQVNIIHQNLSSLSFSFNLLSN